MNEQLINLWNLLTVTNLTNKPIVVDDCDSGETYDITDLINAACEEFVNLCNKYNIELN